MAAGWVVAVISNCLGCHLSSWTLMIKALKGLVAESEKYGTLFHW